MGHLLTQNKGPLSFSSVPRPAKRRAAKGSPRAASDPADRQEAEMPDYRTQAQLLNNIFYSSTAPEAPLDLAGQALPEDNEDLAASTAGGLDIPGLIQDVPLWRVQWAALPGFQEVLHVHVPHYCDMFMRLLAQPRPWRYGHLYLPSGSASLGSPAYELAAGSQAPLVGTLMEVLQAVRFPDGRLLVLAIGLGRFKVVAPRQSVPHSRADVVMLPDWEEVQQQQAVALDALEEGASRDLPVAAAMQASVVAAERAAAAASQVWWQYEVASASAEACRGVQPAIISAANEDEARAFGKRLVAIGNTPVAALPMHGPGSEEEEGHWPSDSDDEEAASVPASTDCAACAAAADAAALSAALDAVAALADASRPRGQAPPDLMGMGMGMGLGSWAGGADTALAPGFSLTHASSGGALQGINSTAERGVPPLREAQLDPLPEEDEEGLRRTGAGVGGIRGGTAGRDVADDIGAGASRSVAMRLEELSWRELDAIRHLAARIRSQPVPLGEGLEQLRPPALAPQPQQLQQDGNSGASSGGGGEEAPAPTGPAGSLHPAYPPLRRAQRLSYALASVLSDVSAHEGRQALLEAPSVSARLRLAVAGLRKHRSVLAAVVAVQGLSPGEGPVE